MGVTPDGPVPLGGGVAPATILADQDVTGIAIELDERARRVGERALPAVLRSGQSAARNHCMQHPAQSSLKLKVCNKNVTNRNHLSSGCWI